MEWIRKDMHWMKDNYIQARRISNIGLLTGSYNVVDMQGTRTALESAVYNEIGRHVKLDLRLCCIKCKSSQGQNVTTTIYSVSVDPTRPC